MVDDASEIRPEWLVGKKRVGVTAGASAPEHLVEDVIAKLKSLGAKAVRELHGIDETIVFPMPRGLTVPRSPPAAD
jgi:4-hydroxy-3-methylbut-2-enyl diphosphate reductase